MNFSVILFFFPFASRSHSVGQVLIIGITRPSLYDSTSFCVGPMYRIGFGSSSKRCPDDVEQRFGFRHLRAAHEHDALEVGIDAARMTGIMYGVRALRNGPGSAEPCGRTRIWSAHWSGVRSGGGFTILLIDRNTLRQFLKRSCRSSADSAALRSEPLGDDRWVSETREFIR
jgi:hypothetical protein